MFSISILFTTIIRVDKWSFFFFGTKDRLGKWSSQNENFYWNTSSMVLINLIVTCYVRLICLKIKD